MLFHKWEEEEDQSKKVLSLSLSPLEQDRLGHGVMHGRKKGEPQGGNRRGATTIHANANKLWKYEYFRNALSHLSGPEHNVIFFFNVSLLLLLLFLISRLTDCSHEWTSV